jgi:hypothetical protein
MRSRSLQHRLDALEAKQAPPDRSAALAAAAEQFDAKMAELTERLRGRDPGPNASVVERLCALAWHDPEAAAAQLKASAQEALAKAEADPAYRWWRYGTA